MKIGLGTPAIIRVEATGDKKPNHKTPKKQEKPNTESKSGQVAVDQNYLPNGLLDVATLIAVSNHKIAESIEAALQSYENMKNK